MRTSEVAGQAGVNSQTLRYYAQAYLASHPELAGRLIGQDAAVRLAGTVFGALLA